METFITLFVTIAGFIVFVWFFALVSIGVTLATRKPSNLRGNGRRSDETDSDTFQTTANHLPSGITITEPSYSNPQASNDSAAHSDYGGSQSHHNNGHDHGSHSHHGSHDHTSTYDPGPSNSYTDNTSSYTDGGSGSSSSYSDSGASSTASDSGSSSTSSDSGGSSY